MSSVQHLREFIRERLTAAAEEIFSEVEKTIVRYEEDVRLLGTYWKPQIKLSRIVQTKSAKHLWELLQDCWKTISGDYLLKLINRMPREEQ
ncbi:hypothetical protein ILYODFUR_037360 [Ilyodon furcidens]|uniref:Uncharacterized protein n=1 Tax=Ilyodon furcidens TaxID=33524 RepID=A0ABV0UPK3_9TELE